MSSTRPRTAIKVIPPTPSPTTSISPTTADPPPNSAATVDVFDDDRTFQRVGDYKIESTAAWLRYHSDIFTHLSAGLINMPVLHIAM